MTEIYYTDTARLDPNRFQSLIETVSEVRRNKALAYRTEESRRTALGAALLLDRALSRYGLSEKEMTYDTGPHGKPFFRNLPDLHFNISHSGTLVAVAISDREVGLDLQCRTLCNRELAHRYFHPDEAARIDRESGDADRLFTLLWAAKESFVKYTGAGLSLPLSDFRILPEPDGTLRPIYHNGQAVCFTLPDLFPDSVAVLCSEKPDPISLISPDL